MISALFTFRRLLAVVVAASLLLQAVPAEAGWFRRTVEVEVAKDLAKAAVRAGARRALTATEQSAARSLSRDALRDVEARTGRKIAAEQKARLAEALKQRSFQELEVGDKATHADEFDRLRKAMRRTWEKETNQTWPKYAQDVYSADGKLVRKAGQNYDLHHIIPKENGGPNVWWNSHPAMAPAEHQAGIHSAGGPLNLIQKLFAQ